MMAEAPTRAEAMPPDPPDPPARIRPDFPPLVPSSNNRSQALSKNLMPAKFTRYLEIDFGETNRRHINPYQILDDIVRSTGEKPKEIVGSSRNRLTLKTNSANQAGKCLQITALAGNSCQIRPHPQFNTSRGLIRLRQYDLDNMEEFRENLLDQYDVEKVEKANFIKSRNNETAYIITFNSEVLPYSVYVPGEMSDSVVQPFGARPMICKKCKEYGHTAKHCKKSEYRCGRCAEIGHQDEECTTTAVKCHHCADNHVAGHKDCPKQKLEQQIIDMVRTEKVTYQRARQKIHEKPIVRTLVGTTAPPFASLFDVVLPTGVKRRTNPWLVEKMIKDHIGREPRRCRGKPGEEDTFIVEISTEQESRLMSTLLRIGNHDVTVTVNNTHDIQKGLIYIQAYDLVEFDTYKRGLQNQYNITSVEHAHWIKTKNNANQALIIGFQGELPTYLDIPCENMRTVVHEYKKLPNFCRKCLDYGHSQRVCREDTQKCTNCTSDQHAYPPCDEDSKCSHCAQTHRTGDKNCQRYKVEQEVLVIQAKSRVSRTQAFVIYNREHPDAFSTSYAAVVQVAGKPPTPPNPPSSKNHQDEMKNQSTAGAGASTSKQVTNQASVEKLRDKYEKEALKRKALSPTQVTTENKKSKVDQNVADGDFRKYARSSSRNYRKHEDGKSESNSRRRSRSQSKNKKGDHRRDRSSNPSRYSLGERQANANESIRGRSPSKSSRK